MNISSFTVVSAVLFLASLYLYKKISPSKLNMGLFSIAALGAMLLFTVYGVAYYFTGDGINEATIYHLKYGLQGAGFLEYLWLIILVIVSLALAAVYILWPVSGRVTNYRHQKYNTLLPYSLLSVSLLSNPALIDIYKLEENTLFSVPATDNQADSDFYDYYRKPELTALNKEHKNIVFIYAESLERTYFDETLFPGLIKGLRELEKKSTYFTDIRQVSGTGWTVGGITASQCGISLFTPSHGNSMAGMDQFLSSAVCLGDLLNKQGYFLNFMGGANLDFAGKGKLFKTHGFSAVYGRDELLPRLADRDYRTSWGLYDDSLFDLAYARFTKLSEAGRKFGLFTLTIDTHHPAGHPSKRCEQIKYGDGANSMLNSVACSDYLIKDYVEKIIHSPYAKNTIIVIVSDHLAMRNTAYSRLKQGKRRNLFMILEPGNDNPAEITTTGSTLDIGSTILPFIGYSGDIGLGRNLLSEKNSPDERSFIHANLSKWRQPITGFWNFPRLQDRLEINIGEKTVRIDDRSFRAPVLVELNERMESILKFEFDRNGTHKSLVQHLQEISDEKYFLLIDECVKVSVFNENMGSEGLCLIAGKGRKYSVAERLDENISYTSRKIQKLLDMPERFMVQRIAHAGGAVNNQTYTNSIDALDSNIRKGFQYFEIDFSFSKDGRLVCLHDWTRSFKKSFGFSVNEKLTLEEFENLVETKSRFRKCSVNSLAKWMKKEPSAYIVTDVKENNLDALNIMVHALPNAHERVIPQIYNPENFSKVRELGFRNIIWTLYRYSGSADEVVRWAKTFDYPIAITMPKVRAETSLPGRLAEINIPTYVHTINKMPEAQKYMKHYRISEIYTDYLQP